MNLLRHGGRALGDTRGVSLLEILITTLVSVLVLSAVGSLYITSRRAFDFGASQAYVQRQGTLIQEQIALWAKNSVAMQAVLCGGNATGIAGRSLAIEVANGTIRCVYQTPAAANTDADLFVCQVATWSAGCTAGTTYNMLNVMGSEVSTRLGAPLRVRNTTFTRVTCVDPGPCWGTGPVALSVTSPLVNARFDLTDNTIPNPQQGTYVGMRFGFGITSRN